MGRRLTPESLRIDPEKVSKRIEGFIKEIFERSGASVIVIGMSGGIDSSVVVCLCSRAVGPEKIHALFLPTNVTKKEDYEDASSVAKMLGIDLEVIEITPIVDTFKEVFSKCGHFDESDRISLGNVMARIRMITLYYHANRLNGVVAGTGNKSELLVGYFTKYGDGGVDFLPIGDLYKTQVRQLARYLGIPERIIKKVPTAGLWAGQTDEGELGITYDLLDLILHGLVDLGMSPEEVAEDLSIPLERVLHVKRMIESSEHKRQLPPIAKISD